MGFRWFSNTISCFKIKFFACFSVLSDRFYSNLTRVVVKCQVCQSKRSGRDELWWPVNRNESYKNSMDKIRVMLFLQDAHRKRVQNQHRRFMSAVQRRYLCWETSLLLYMEIGMMHRRCSFCSREKAKAAVDDHLF